MNRPSVPATTNTTRKPARRRFLNWLWVALAALGALQISWVVGSLLKSRRMREEKRLARHVVDGGMVRDYRPGQVSARTDGSFYLCCLEDGSFIALSRTCTHLGCSVPWDTTRKQFVCPCHGSTFDLAGRVLSAPAPRPLDYYPARIENGMIRVDVSRPLRREHFSASQTVRV